MRKIPLLLAFFLLFFHQVSFSYLYNEGDWTSYTMTRYVTSIAMDDRTVYFGTSGGVIRYNKIERVWEDPFTTSDGLPDNRVNRIAYDKNEDVIWVDTPLGFASYNPTFKEWRREASFPLEWVRSDRDSLKLPDFFMEFGYDFFPDGYILDQRLSRYDITDYLRDDWGDNLWLATWGLGVAFGSLRSWNLQLYTFGLYQNDVKDICIDGGVAWFGGNDIFQNRVGITKYDRDKDKWEYFVEGYENNLGSARVNAIRASQNFVWFGTTQGLEVYSKKKEEWSFYKRAKELRNSYITCLEYYRGSDKKDEGILYVGTYIGLCSYKVKKDSIAQFKDQNISSEYINCLKLSHNYLWVGTQMGTYRIPLAGGNAGVFSTPDGITNSNVNDIEEDKDKVWFATDRGILGYNPITEEREVYQISGNYPGSQPLRLAIDGKNLWVGTKNGVWRMDKEKKIWDNFTIFDGLIDDEIQAMVLDGDYIWFGTPKGATRLYWNNPRILR
ncbi:MAG TPA: hypothetical protein VGB16_01355 [candidate division Zixibacteria bacterium]